MAHSNPNVYWANSIRVIFFSLIKCLYKIPCPPGRSSKFERYCRFCVTFDGWGGKTRCLPRKCVCKLPWGPTDPPPPSPYRKVWIRHWFVCECFPRKLADNFQWLNLTWGLMLFFVCVVLSLRIVNFCYFRVVLLDCFSLLIKVRMKWSPVACLGTSIELLGESWRASKEKKKQTNKITNLQLLSRCHDVTGNSR